MKRRMFLRLMGAAAAAPALPAGLGAAPAVQAAGYNRYMYGLAVFHARTRASVSAGDLIARLRINAAQAEAMMGEMSASGVLRHAASGMAQAAHPMHRLTGKALRKNVAKVADWIADEAPPEAQADTRSNEEAAT